MTLANLIILARAMNPGAKASVINDTVLTLLINNGVVDIAAYTLCLKTNKKFNVVAEQSEYNLSSVITDYLGVDKPGLWWNQGDADDPEWKQLNSKTLKALDNDRINWRDLSSDDPQDYSIDGDILTIVPKPDTSLSNGFWLYYGKKPTPMTLSTHYPFSGTTTEFTHLTIFDDAVLSYVKWKIQPMLNKDTAQDFIVEKQAYEAEREEKFKIFKRRLDIAHSSDLRFQGIRP